ncbi:MAG: T9SS type A sorting domain-containing protein [Bacteroidota bacterium]
MRNLIILIFLFCLLVTNFRSQTLNVSISSSQNTICNGQCNGSASAIASGGTGNYSFTWSNGSSGSNVNNLCAGNNYVIVNDGLNQDTVTFVTGQPSPINISMTTPASICPGATVNICPTISGGNPPYTYSWAPIIGIINPNLNCPTFNPSSSTVYTLTVVDMNGCVANNTVSISVNTVSASANNNGPICAGSNIQLFAFGGVSYLWTGPNGFTSNLQNPNITNANLNMSGVYTVSVTNVTGCTTTASTNVIVSNPPSLNPFLNNPVCSGSNIVFNSNSSGANTFNWAGPNGFSSTLPNPVILNAQLVNSGTYTLTASSIPGCSTTSTLSVIVTPTPTLSLVSLIEPSCNLSNGAISIVGNGGTSPYFYSGNLCGVGSFGPSSINTLSNVCSGQAIFFITDGNGCSDTLQIAVSDSCDLSWPGDANDDLIADNMDMLEIGLGYGFVGQQRIVQGNNWNGLPSYTWGTLANGITDDKHIDSDGNGLIDLADTNAIVLNYGLTRPSSRIGEFNQKTTNGSNSILKVDILQDTITAGGNGNIIISLGDSINPTSSFYGIAFTLNFNSNIVDPSTFRINANGSWAGIQNTNLFCSVLNDGNSGNVKAVISRFDHINSSGFGSIANMAFQTKTNYNGTQNIIFNLSDVKLIDNVNNTLPVTAINDSAIGLDPLLKTTEENESYFKIYPNPFQSEINFLVQEYGKYEISIHDISGRIVYKENIDGKLIKINTTNFSRGTYLCTLSDSQGKKSFNRMIKD